MAAALAELCEKRTLDGTLTRAAYEELGKVEGVIAKLADEAYEYLDAGIHLSRDILVSRSGMEVPDLHRYELGKQRATLRFCPTYDCPVLSW